MSPSGNPWLIANPELARRLDADCFRESQHNCADRPLHALEPLAERVGLMAWQGILVEGYIEGQIGICVEIHGGKPALDAEAGNFCFLLTFQQESRFGHLEIDETRPLWVVNIG